VRTSLRPVWRRPEDQRGATLVEFAFILPVFVLFVFGVIDFGWAFAQNLDVKQTAREGARLAVVDGGTTPGMDCPTLKSAIKSRINDLNPAVATVSLTRTGASIGDTATITVSYPLTSLSGVSNKFLSGTMTSTVKMRMERAATWATPC
jgi:Flp pilus assembly protein TadG